MGVGQFGWRQIQMVSPSRQLTAFWRGGRRGGSTRTPATRQSQVLHVETKRSVDTMLAKAKASQSLRITDSSPLTNAVPIMQDCYVPIVNSLWVRSEWVRDPPEPHREMQWVRLRATARWRLESAVAGSRSYDAAHGHFAVVRKALVIGFDLTAIVEVIHHEAAALGDAAR